MKRWHVHRREGGAAPFSTLNSGLRDETPFYRGYEARPVFFQYPQLGPTR